MNLCFLTGQIVTWPEKYISIKGKTFTHFFVKIPNPKKGPPFLYIHASARQETGFQIVKWYAKGDYILIEGNIKICIDKNKNYHIEINIIRESPLVLEL